MERIKYSDMTINQKINAKQNVSFVSRYEGNRGYLGFSIYTRFAVLVKRGSFKEFI
ncbi:MAG: hypothetical protein MJ209_00365 [archaeon]|nr:hypothetical protein [archaeon]